ncbi:MAG: hypothetical protein D6800_10770, partial [Candidatus Zixiibacteriota bacterium]
MGILRHATFGTLLVLLPLAATAQRFDFDKLHREAARHTVIVEMDIELSFGLQSTNQKERHLGTIVDRDGLVLFDGSSLLEDAGMSPLSGVSVKTTPKTIKVLTMDGKSYDADYVGVDRFTRLGFVRIKTDTTARFEPVRFALNYRFKVGDWLALYMLLPEFVTPALAADIGMVSNIVESPEF